VSFRVRLPGQGSFFGGTSTGRTINVTCDQPDNPNLLRFCDRRVDGTTPPLQTSLKMSGSYTLPYGLQLGISYVRQPGDALSTNWLITRATRYAASCAAPCTPNALVIPGLSETSLSVPLIPSGISRGCSVYGSSGCCPDSSNHFPTNCQRADQVFRSAPRPVAGIEKGSAIAALTSLPSIALMT
jgi:hypothetical protein